MNTAMSRTGNVVSKIMSHPRWWRMIPGDATAVRIAADYAHTIVQLWSLLYWQKTFKCSFKRRVFRLRHDSNQVHTGGCRLGIE